MKIITVSSYFGSGSSAVTDFLTEFDGVKSLTTYEFRFAHDPDGLSELEYNLVENFNRHNSGHALKRYKALVDYYGDHFLVKRYEPFFSNQWKKLSYEYIESLTDFSFPGCWQYDFYDKGPWYEFWHKLPDRLSVRLFNKHCMPKNIITYASHPSEEKFLACTRSYTDKLMQAANPENAPFLLLDQILPSSNVERHRRYFNNIITFVVDRDPRDIYLQNKYRWHDGVVPEDVETFCKWYAYTRNVEERKSWNPEHIKLIQFEDLIYKYEETTAEVLKMLGINKSAHIAPRTKFIPEKSIANTRQWEKYPEDHEAIRYIEEHLPQFLYKYEV